MNVLNWLSIIWDEFDSVLVKKSFKCCGITSKDEKDFHSASSQMITKRSTLNDFIDNLVPSDEIDGFDPDDVATFDNEIDDEETNEIEFNGGQLDGVLDDDELDESYDDDYELSDNDDELSEDEDELSEDGDEISEEDDEDENLLEEVENLRAEQKENDKSNKRKAIRAALTDKILNTLPTTTASSSKATSSTVSKSSTAARATATATATTKVATAAKTTTKSNAIAQTTVRESTNRGGRGGRGGRGVRRGRGGRGHCTNENVVDTQASKRPKLR